MYDTIDKASTAQWDTAEFKTPSLLSLITEQLCTIYESQEWNKCLPTRPMMRAYVSELINRKNVFWCLDKDRVVGFCETWKITYEQLGRMVCNEEMVLDDENTTDGYISYVFNVWIDEKYRKGEVYRMMRNRWYELYGGTEFYCGHAKRKHTGLYKVFKVSDLKSKLFKGA